MNTDLFVIERDTTMLKSRRLWYVVAFLLFLLSVIVQQPLAFLAALFTLIVGIVPELWYRLALRHMVVRQKLDQHHLFFGEVVRLSITVENHKLLPLPWLEAENKIRPPLAFVRKRTSHLQNLGEDTFTSTWLLWSFQRVTRNYRLLCHTRGMHTFGPIRLRSSDPFGWLECEVRVPASEALLVYPLIAPLETLGFASVHPLGEHASQHQLLEDPLRFAGVRDYQIGDDPRRIHWKASVRSGGLQSKMYEPSSLRRLLVLLDAWNYTDEAKGIDLELQEFTISVAGSLAVWALDEGYMLGLLANCAMMTSPAEETAGPTRDGSQETTFRNDNDLAADKLSSPGVHLAFASDHGQYERVLSLLARLVPRSNYPIEKIMDIEDGMFPMGTTVVLVSAVTSLNAPTVDRLLDLRARGAAVYLVLTGEPGTTAQTETYDLSVQYPGGKELWRELVRTVVTTKSEALGTSTTPLQLD